jgi:PAS domain S-box-containing protein
MSTDDSVYITDMQGRITFVNKAFCNTYGYKEQEIIGENSTVLWIGKQQTENTRSVFQTRTIGSSWEVGFYHKRNDDSVFPVSLSRSTIKDSNGNEVAIVGVARDISERILIEEELNTENQNLKKRIRELEEKLGIEHSYSASNA